MQKLKTLLNMNDTLLSPGKRTGFYNAHIVERIDLSSRHLLLRVAFDKGKLLDFIPGQFINLGIQVKKSEPEATFLSSLPGQPQDILRRAYSIASSIREMNYYEFYLNVVPHGMLTPTLFRLDPGDAVWMEPQIRGRFTLGSVAPTDHVVAVATGTGVAPFVSMLRSYNEPLPWKSFTLVYGARKLVELGYNDELGLLEKNRASFNYLRCLSRESLTSSQFSHGWVQDFFRENAFHESTGIALSPDNTHVFLCGNADMIREVRELLVPFGFEKRPDDEESRIHSEIYF
ncbi:ferredoxin--NADP reductase [bacterium]|nr:ferredoxin--NADP reductase [bacterium]